jgi:hypothetical protein
MGTVDEPSIDAPEYIVPDHQKHISRFVKQLEELYTLTPHSLRGQYYIDKRRDAEAKVKTNFEGILMLKYSNAVKSLNVCIEKRSINASEGEKILEFIDLFKDKTLKHIRSKELGRVGIFHKPFLNDEYVSILSKYKNAETKREA